MEINGKKKICAQKGKSDAQSGRKTNDGITARPFLKWAGGKRQLLKQMSPLLPMELENGQITKYAEPFLGGGAMFFYLSQTCKFDEIHISDANKDLIMTYQTIRDDVDSLIIRLAEMESQYLALSEIGRERFYYQISRIFNQERLSMDYSDANSSWVERAAQLIFLNHTCFNGVYRVNSKGEFNISFGRYENPNICDAENLRAVSKVLQDVVITAADFGDCEQIVDDRTLVYFDPPYIPMSKTANFTSYTASGFDDSKQRRLASLSKRLTDKGVYVILSNSDYKPFDVDDFIRENYGGFTINTMRARRNINCKALGRAEVDEVLITNYAIHCSDPRSN